MKYNNFKKYFVLILFFWVSLYPLFTSAVSDIPLKDEEISVEMIPAVPEPYKELTINLKSYAINLNKANISWQSKDGVVVSGTGKTSYTIIAPGPNDSIYFDISITPSEDFNSIKKRVYVNPADLDVFWESVDGYTPPFYRGKALPVSGSTIKVVAIPNTNITRKGLGSFEYTWSKDDTVLEDKSGYNKNAFVFKNGILDRVNNLSVIVSSVTGNFYTKKFIEVPLYNPKIIFYKKTQGEGIFYNMALDKETNMAENEITIYSEPFFLSTKNSGNNFNYSWRINDEITPTPTKQKEITIRPTSKNGYINIDLIIENINGLLQKVQNSLKITL